LFEEDGLGEARGLSHQGEADVVVTEHKSDLELDLLRITGAADVHLSACESCRARARSLEADAAAFLATHDVAALAREAAKVTPLRPRRAVPVWAAAITAMAAMMLLFMAPDESIRTKGAGPRVELFVMEGGEPRAIRGPVDPRAELAVKLSPTGETFVRVLWASSPEQIDALFPAESSGAWRIDAPAWLDRKIVLDGAPQAERLVAVLCDHDFDHGAALSEPEDCEVTSIEVLKR